jgi:8-oxo-dGTP pyrophosphatase MutT (NUDIX family)
MDSTQAVNTLVKGISGRPDAPEIVGSLLLQLQKPPETGITLTGHNADGSEGQVYAYNWARPQAGSANVILANDKNGVTHILFTKKHNEDTLYLPGGFMEAKASPTADGKAVGTPYDTDLQKTAIREGKEETGIDLVKPTLVHQYTNDFANSVQNVNIYLSDYTGKKGGLPALNPIDTGEIAEAKWVPLSAVTPDGKAGGEPIYPSYVQAIEKALEWKRDKELEASGVTAEKIMSYSTLAKPASELSPEAEEYHRNALQIARQMQVTRARFEKQAQRDVFTRIKDFVTGPFR